MVEEAANITNAEDWLTIAEACEFLKVSEPTIFRWMKSGKLSYFKIGKATRFRKRDLDLVVEKVVGQPEGEILIARCAVCGHSRLIDGKMASTGNIYFKPAKTKFFVLAESNVQVRAKCCPVCGHIQMMADTKKLDKLIKKEDIEEEDEA